MWIVNSDLFGTSTSRLRGARHRCFTNCRRRCGGCQCRRGWRYRLVWYVAAAEIASAELRPVSTGFSCRVSRPRFASSGTRERGDAHARAVERGGQAAPPLTITPAATIGTARALVKRWGRWCCSCRFLLCLPPSGDPLSGPFGH